MIENNICLLTDSYKVTHHYFYPENTEKIYSYMESRTGSEFNKTIFYGLQYIIKKYLEGQVVTEEKVYEAKNIIDQHIGKDIFNLDDWLYIADKLEGKLPIEIKAVSEGTPVDISNVLMTVVNTDKRCYWLPNYLEPLLLQVWYPSTVATLSAEVRKMFDFYLNVTSSSRDNLEFMLHDFGYRGASSTESASLAGSAHLLSFSGTDTIPALSIPENYYNSKELYGYSVQATEHSVMTAQGIKHEMDQAINVIKHAHDGILSMVIDSYNYKNFLVNACNSEYELNSYIRAFLERCDTNKVVFRPDSGEPISTTIDCLEIIGEGFGTTQTSNGYKVFDANVGLLWSDGLDYKVIRDILFSMKSQGWAAENIIFGMGGGLHTSVNRDTQRNAFKSSAQQRSGVWYDIFKKPLDSSKKSKSGRFKLIRENNIYKTVPIDSEGIDCLQTVFRNGELLVDDSFENIRSRARSYISHPKLV
ncbi:nicotinate phosphoribosyltransferase [Methanosphaera sp. WGK6]|uniref:nicotinate phosphoribosyltransferase n=1 Tax=Methanosphaera sp. WGK6 TaxID=1561964 RepID=UPI00084C7A6A|nr:nicotinate phosphoribosyltransferase [Methanosphaera sp. WGK6]OED30403.1 nicotinate phosphoribosyltransferase [Methanosphaera sp. WGK6]